MKSDLIENRQMRIFISSTFRDMHAERDYLVQRVFPSLRRYCEGRDVAFQEIDLRWGISEKESQDGKVVDLCLKEIKNTTPFFIGLLGERYGWVPNEGERRKIADTTDVFQDYAWVRDELQNGTSITEIEIQDGVLRAEKEGEKVNAYFYLRSPDSKMKIPEGYKPEDFREAPDSEGERKLQRLKQTLREQETYPVSDYEDAEQLGKLVERDFKALVDVLFPLDGVPSELEKERLKQRAFLKRMTAGYVPIDEYDNRIDYFAESAERGLAITGESGMGKSALLAHWVQRRGKLPNEKIIYHAIGQSGDEGDYRKITKRLTNEVKDLYKIPPAAEPLQPGKNGSEQKKILGDLLFSVTAHSKLIVILDGIDKLAEDDAKDLTWLPLFPETVKFIFSTRKGDLNAESYFTRMGYPVIKAAPLDVNRRKTLIVEYLALFGKHLSDQQIERIAKDKESENPLALRTLLDELRMFGVHERLDGEIDRYLAAGSVSELFTLVLDRCEKTFNYGTGNFVRDVLSLLYVSQSGLSETEIRVFSGRDGKETPNLYWLQLFDGMGSCLSIQDGKVMFSHEFIRDAVKNRYLRDDAALRECRMKLVKAMEDPYAVISPYRKYNEIAYQLDECADWDALYNLLLDFKILRYLEIDELPKYWRGPLYADRKKYAIEKYLELDPQDRSPAKMSELFQGLSAVAEELANPSFIAAMGENVFTRILRAVFSLSKDHVDSSVAVAFAGEAIRYNTNNAEAYLKRGNAYLGKKDYEKAIADFTEALRLTNDAIVYMNRGLAYSGQKDYEKAIADFNESIRLYPNYALSYYNRGNTYQNGKKDYDKAIADYTEAIHIDPDFDAAYVNRGWSYYGKEDYDQAIVDYTEAIHINPNRPGGAGNIDVAKKAKELFDKSFTKKIKSVTTLFWQVVTMAVVSYIADGFDKGWLHSLAIFVNVGMIVWFAQTIITGVLKLFRPKSIFLFFRILRILTILAFVLDIGSSVYFIKVRKTGNPVSVVLQNPFEAARKRFFGADKDDKTDMQADILPPDPVEGK